MRWFQACLGTFSVFFVAISCRLTLKYLLRNVDVTHIHMLCLFFTHFWKFYKATNIKFLNETLIQHWVSYNLVDLHLVSLGRKILLLIIIS